jgi:hypothetical protein
VQTGNVNTQEHGAKPARESPSKWLLTAFLAAVVALSSFGTVDRVAEAEYEKLFQRALVTFALARTLNGLISAVQGTELALQPAGVGVTLTPGEILDPVNDLVERFSWIMLGATLSLGIQQVLLDIGQWWVLKTIVAVLALAWIGVSWRRKGAVVGGGGYAWLWRALIVVLLLRFAVPLAMIVNEAVYDLFLEGRYVESTAVIESAEADIEVINEAASATAEDESVFDALGRTFDSTRQSLDFRQKLASISERATDLIEHLLQLGVVFIFQTGLLPIAFLWLFLRLLRNSIRRYS